MHCIVSFIKWCSDEIKSIHDKNTLSIEEYCYLKKQTQFTLPVLILYWNFLIVFGITFKLKQE